MGVEVGGGICDDADGEVDSCYGFQDLDVRAGGVDVGGVDGAEVGAVN